MELKIVDPESNELIGQYGISQERADELARGMDEIVRTIMPKGKGVIIVGGVFKDIAALCNTPEELVFCCISHCSYMVRKHQMLYCAPNLK